MAARKIDNKEYMYYLVMAGRLLSGWEYKEDAEEAAQDLHCLYDEEPRIYTRAHLICQKIYPHLNESWHTLESSNAHIKI